VRLVAGGRLHAELGLVAHWSQAGSILADLRDRRVRGKAVLCIPPAGA
jgi:NADPH2:quinone reductase